MPICQNPRYGQCGGIDADGHPWTKDYGHDSCCPEGFECQYQSTYFSQCKPQTESDEIARSPAKSEVVVVEEEEAA